MTGKLRGNYTNYLQSLILFFTLVIAVTLLTPRFFSVSNLSNILRQLTANLLISAGMTFVIISGRIDMSVGSILVLSAIIAVLLLEKYPVFVAVAACLLTGLLCGTINGLLTIMSGQPSFIITLGTSMILKSLAFILSGGKVLYNGPEKIKTLAQGTIFGLPNTLFIILGIYLVCRMILKETPYGKKVYALGSNPKGAMYSGINVNRIKTSVFIISGALASFSGILFVSQLGAIQAYSGEGMELESIAAVVIGGTGFFGGTGGVLQTILGVLIIGLTRNALNLLHISAFWHDFFTALIIIFAVFLDISRQKARRIA